FRAHRREQKRGSDEAPSSGETRPRTRNSIDCRDGKTAAESSIRTKELLYLRSSRRTARRRLEDKRTRRGGRRRAPGAALRTSAFRIGRVRGEAARLVRRPTTNKRVECKFRSRHRSAHGADLPRPAWSQRTGAEMNPLEILQLARADLACYAVAQWPGFELAAHHRLLVEMLEAVERGEIRRLLVAMPPRHG